MNTWHIHDTWHMTYIRHMTQDIWHRHGTCYIYDMTPHMTHETWSGTHDTWKCPWHMVSLPYNIHEYDLGRSLAWRDPWLMAQWRMDSWHMTAWRITRDPWLWPMMHVTWRPMTHDTLDTWHLTHMTWWPGIKWHMTTWHTNLYDTWRITWLTHDTWPWRDMKPHDHIAMIPHGRMTHDMQVFVSNGQCLSGYALSSLSGSRWFPLVPQPACCELFVEGIEEVRGESQRQLLHKTQTLTMYSNMYNTWYIHTH
jgi:hypothetical protein